MRMIKMLVIALFAMMVTGCAMTEYAEEYFVNAVDVNQYEEAKEIDDALCDPDILARLQKTRTDAWYKATVKDCQSRNESAVPLTN